jgi:DNA polymerase-3 subunit chi
MSLPRIDFYLVENDESHAHWDIACRLVEKAYRQGHRLFIFCETLEEALTLDERLWTYREDSFIPHHLQGDGPNPPPPVQIGCSPPTHHDFNLLMNFSEQVPVFYTHFQRVLEMVPYDETKKSQSRIRYQTYRTQGCTIHLHKL